MNRRKLLLGSGATLLTILAGCSSDEANDGNGNGNTNGSDDDGENDEQSVDTDLTGVYNYQKYDAFTTPESDDGVHWESDDETQYVGAQVQLTNETDSEISVGEYEIAVLAGGDGENITFDGSSNTEPLGSIEAGETVETWLVFTVSPGTELTGFGPTQWAEHSFGLTHDEDLEIALEEYEG